MCNDGALEIRQVSQRFSVVWGVHSTYSLRTTPFTVSMFHIVFLYTFQKRTCQGGFTESQLWFLSPSCNSIPQMGKGRTGHEFSFVISEMLQILRKPWEAVREAWAAFVAVFRLFWEHYPLPHVTATPWASNESLEQSLLHIGDSLRNGLQLKPGLHWDTGVVTFWEASLCHAFFGGGLDFFFFFWFIHYAEL